MQILSECNLATIVAELLNGKTVVFPTETSYGLGCDATNQEAVDRIFKIKGRREDKPLLAVVPNVEMAKQYLVWNELLDKIATRYWPGPITAIAEYRISNVEYRTLANGVVSKENTVAVRVTAHPLLKSITEKLGRPLVATSANISDTGDLYNSADVIKQFENKENQPDIILNYGILPARKPTTIVCVVGNEFKIIRQGEIKVEL